MTDKVTTISTYIASCSVVLLSVINSYAAAIGILIALITLGMNFWFKLQHLKLAKNKRSTYTQDNMMKTQEAEGGDE